MIDVPPPPPLFPQIHLSLTGVANEMAIDFVAFADGQSVSYTPSGGVATVAAASCKEETMNEYTAYFCTAVMAPLAPETTYSYTVGVTGGPQTAAFTFSNGVWAHGRATPRFAVYADFGFGNDESLKYLVDDAQAGGFDVVIHAGDWAYDLDGSKSTTGNAFMNSIQPYAATVPYMGSAG